MQDHWSRVAIHCLGSNKNFLPVSDAILPLSVLFMLSFKWIWLEVWNYESCIGSQLWLEIGILSQRVSKAKSWTKFSFWHLLKFQSWRWKALFGPCCFRWRGYICRNRCPSFPQLSGMFSIASHRFQMTFSFNVWQIMSYF